MHQLVVHITKGSNNDISDRCCTPKQVIARFRTYYCTKVSLDSNNWVSDSWPAEFKGLGFARGLLAACVVAGRGRGEVAAQSIRRAGWVLFRPEESHLYSQNVSTVDIATKLTVAATMITFGVDIKKRFCTFVIILYLNSQENKLQEIVYSFSFHMYYNSIEKFSSLMIYHDLVPWNELQWFFCNNFGR